MSDVGGITASTTERDVPVVPDFPRVSYLPPAPVASVYVLRPGTGKGEGR